MKVGLWRLALSAAVVGAGYGLTPPLWKQKGKFYLIGKSHGIERLGNPESSPLSRWAISTVVRDILRHSQGEEKLLKKEQEEKILSAFLSYVQSPPDLSANAPSSSVSPFLKERGKSLTAKTRLYLERLSWTHLAEIFNLLMEDDELRAKAIKKIKREKEGFFETLPFLYDGVALFHLSLALLKMLEDNQGLESRLREFLPLFHYFVAQAIAHSSHPIPSEILTAKKRMDATLSLASFLASYSASFPLSSPSPSFFLSPEREEIHKSLLSLARKLHSIPDVQIQTQVARLVANEVLFYEDEEEKEGDPEDSFHPFLFISDEILKAGPLPSSIEFRKEMLRWMVNVSASKTGRGVVIREWLPFLEEQFNNIKNEKQKGGEEGEKEGGAEGLLFLVVANLLKEEESGQAVWDSVPSLREYVLDLLQDSQHGKSIYKNGQSFPFLFFLSNLSNHPPLRSALSSRTPLRSLHPFFPEENRSNDHQRTFSRLIKNLVTCQETARFAASDTPLISSLLDICLSSDDIFTQRNVLSALENIALNSSSLGKEGKEEGGGKEWVNRATGVLDSLSRSSDMIVQSLALRTKAAIVSHSVRSPKYIDGLALLYDGAGKKGGEGGGEGEVDIVFIHGVTGDLFGTWAAPSPPSPPSSPSPSSSSASSSPSPSPSSPSPPPAPTPSPSPPPPSASYPSLPPPSSLCPQKICWPQEWLSKDTPNARILSVGYPCHYSGWVGDALPLDIQCNVILEKLRLARVGVDRPVIFVAHSFGGLVVKYMMTVTAASHPEYSKIVDQLAGVVFYGVPHRGTKLGNIHRSLYRGTAAMDYLKHNHPSLLSLNKQFLSDVACPTLSIAEGGLTYYQIMGTGVEIQVVDPVSANPMSETGDVYPVWKCEPGEGGEKGVIERGDHSFLVLECSHRDVCKPNDREDLRYSLVLSFIEKVMGKNNK